MLYFLFVLIIILMLLYLMPIAITIEIKRIRENDVINIEIKTLYGLVKLRTEIPFMKIVFENGKPVFKYKVEVANKKRSKLFAQFTKLFSVSEGEKIYNLLKGKIDKIKPVLKYLLSKLEISNFRLRFTLGTGDAAETGILYGAVWIVIGSIMALTSSYLNIIEPKISVVPIFNKVQLSVDFNCIITTRLGHIINTGIRIIPALQSRAF